MLGLIARLRGDYLLILGFIALVWLFSRFVLESPIGDALPLVLRIALLMYAWLAMFSLIGGVLFERRLDIGLDDVHTPESLDTGEDDDAPDERVRDREIDRIYAEWRGGAHANAWKTVLALVSQSRTRSPSCAGSINARRSGPTAAWPIDSRASCCRACWPSAALVKRSISSASDCGRMRDSGRRAAPIC